ncbi:hypothetical protein H2200_007871 [Cladophialophora chaetospira]|uniref:RRM domain-containing protein n=1 Tax=Cladophialophora chaetospira TaxID=386627 RepID=A0AA38X6K3_9EURO|nr:hypothetical protein H2200_007871 [Cladophialophora chaetospira]
MANPTFGTDADAITISSQQYDSLLETTRKYHALRQALLAGGVSNDSLDVLISSHHQPTSLLTPDDSPIDGPAPDGLGSTWAPAPTARPFFPNTCSNAYFGQRQDLPRLQTTLNPCNPSPPVTALTDGEEIQEELMAAAQVDEQEFNENTTVRRSLVITGLSGATTLHSVAKVLRGGMILEMYLRKRYSAAHVSFVDPVAAEKFFEFAQTNEIYIQGKKVMVDWDQNQRWIKPNMANRIAFSGLTRNLCIRFAKEEWTAQAIRDDLDHIHQLEIVDIFFRNGHAYISLNSIQHALTARTCMYSRLKYKRWKIDCWPDDCAQPLPNPPVKQPQYSLHVPSATARLNRFAALYQGSEESQESIDLMDFSEYDN